MDGFKEFQGKNLDDAIREACSFFDASREKLEIDIIQDSKTGIFGLVGARKAKVRARRVQLRSAVENALGRKAEAAPAAPSSAPEDGPADNEKPRAAAPPKAPAKGQGRGRPRDAEARRSGATQDASRQEAGRQHASQADAARPDTARSDAVAPSPSSTPAAQTARGASEERREKVPATSDKPSGDRASGDKPAGDRSSGDRSSGDGPSGQRRNANARRPRQQETAPNAAPVEDMADDVGEGLQSVPFEDLDQERLRALSLEVVARLVEPIVGQLPLTVELLDGRVSVRLDCGEDSGLLIGREGQTLASLQYLASRMVSRGMNAVVRVQLDAGEYRLRQDEKLRDMALALAEKVRSTGKSYSTRPLSSYHRRIVHMVLQDAPDVQTRSSGDGPLKRVVVQRKKN